MPVQTGVQGLSDWLNRDWWFQDLAKTSIEKGTATVKHVSTEAGKTGRTAATEAGETGREVAKQLPEAGRRAGGAFAWNLMIGAAVVGGTAYVAHQTGALRAIRRAIVKV